MVRKQWYVGLVTERPQKTERDEVAFVGPGGWELRLKRVRRWIFEPWTCTWGPFDDYETAFSEAQRILRRWGVNQGGAS